MHDPEYLNFLQQFLTTERRARFDEVLDCRTRHLTVVLEKLAKTNNISACLRSCDAFGIQDVHLISKRRDYRINDQIDMGASYWLTLHDYPPDSEATADCLSGLKEKGYRVVATSLQHDAKSPDCLNLDEPVAVVFGGERPGVSETVLEMADDFLQIHTVGFVQSLNVSVAAAITLQRLTERLRDSKIEWKLSEHEKVELLENWIISSVERQHPRVAQSYLKSR